MDVYVELEIGGIGRSNGINYALGELSLGGLPPNVLIVEWDLCDLIGRDDAPTLVGLVPPEQHLIIRAPEIDLAARLKQLAADDPIRQHVDVDGLMDLGQLSKIGGNQRQVVIELLALLEPDWWRRVVTIVRDAVGSLADLRGLSLRVVHINATRSTLGTVGAAGMFILASIEHGIRLPTGITDTVLLLDDSTQRVPNKIRARAGTAAALDEIDRRARGVVIDEHPMFSPVSGVHVLIEASSAETAMAVNASVRHLVVRGRLTGPYLAAQSSRSAQKHRAEVCTSVSARLMIADSATLRERLVAQIGCAAAETLANTPASIPIHSHVEALVSGKLGTPSALVESLSRALGVRSFSQRLVRETVSTAGRSIDREVFARADGVLDEEEVRAVATHRVHELTLAFKHTADREMDTSLLSAISVFDTAVSQLQVYREGLLKLKETSEQESATWRTKINAAVGKAAAEAENGVPSRRSSAWAFVKNALRVDDQPSAIPSAPSTPDELRHRYVISRGELHLINALVAAVDQGIEVVRAYQADICALCGKMANLAGGFRRDDERLGREAAERIRRFAGISLAAEEEVVEFLAKSRLGTPAEIASKALRRLGAVEIGMVTSSELERVLREEASDASGSREYSLENVVDELPDQILSRLAHCLVPDRPPVLFDPGVHAPDLEVTAHVSHPRMATAVRRANPLIAVHPAPDGKEWFAFYYTGVYSVRDLECYPRCKADLDLARAEGWAGQICDRRVLALPDDGTDDSALETIIAKAYLAGALQASTGGRWYYVAPTCALSPAGMDSAALHSAFGDSLGGSIAELVRTLREKPLLRSSLTAAWHGWVALRAPTQVIEAIDAAVASRKLNKLSGAYSLIKMEFLKALHDNAYDQARMNLSAVAGRNGRSRENVDVA